MIWRLFLAVILLGVIVGGIVGFNMFRDKMIAGYFASMQPPPVTVSTVEVEPVTWYPGLEAVGTAHSNSGVELAVETAGIINGILFEANEKVTAGQHLAQIDDAIERADLAASQAELDLAETQLVRAQELRSRGVTAISDLDQAQALATSSRAQVERLTAVMAQKSLEAPFDGIIGIPQVDVGGYVMPGTVYATLQDLDNMRVDFSVPEQQVRLVQIGMPVTLTTEVGATNVKGKISAIEPRIDPNSRLVNIRAQFDNPAEGGVNPGQFLRVRIELPPEDNVIALPQTVVSSTLYGDSVFVVRTEGEGDQAQSTVEQVFVKADRRSLGLVEIAEGLKDGDIVVSAGQNRLTGGARVTVDNTVNPTGDGAPGETVAPAADINDGTGAAAGANDGSDGSARTAGDAGGADGTTGAGEAAGDGSAGNSGGTAGAAGGGTATGTGG